ncbi:FAD-linked oxidase-like protein [Flagelloscypha sp. PMI_526]|nr:FAD-linked oxidase-like protein [Flagelloscypha sp. PMI_526]
MTFAFPSFVFRCARIPTVRHRLPLPLAATSRPFTSTSRNNASKSKSKNLKKASPPPSRGVFTKESIATFSPKQQTAEQEHVEPEPINAQLMFKAAVIASLGLSGLFWFKPTWFLGNERGSNGDIAKAIVQLKVAFPQPGQVDTDDESLQLYGSSDNWYLPASPHSVIVRPNSTEDVVKIVNIARKFNVPMIPYSGATSLEGHFSGNPNGSICIDMSGMDKIIAIREEDSDMTVQSGIKWEDINNVLKEKNISLFFPLDPGPGATIGGMIGTGCSGTNAVRYGTAKGEWFLSLTVVLPNGEVIKTRQRARKSSAGFDTTKLFIGAEGTLGIVTEATIRLAPLLPTKVAVASFPNVEHAVNAVQDILNSAYGAHVQCVELLDDNMMNAMNTSGFVDRKWPVRDTLFFKLQGDDASVKMASKIIQTISQKHKSDSFVFAATDKEAENLWQNRKYAFMSSIASVPGSKCWTTDVCVPVSKLPQLVAETKQDLKDSGLTSTIVGHVGDGNFHALILFQTDDELPKVKDAVHRMVHRAIALDGTCTGEHGVGIGKREFLSEELGEGTVELMKTIKRAVDPLNLMNPGKLYPDPKPKS